jgi:hypothetical protein
MDLRIIVLLSLQLDLLGLELEGAAYFGAGPFNRGEEVHKQLIGTPKLIGYQLPGVPKPMSMIVLLRTRYTVRIVVPQQASPIHVMQRERIPDAMRPRHTDFDFRDPKLDAPAVDEPVAPMVVIQETSHRLIMHA